MLFVVADVPFVDVRCVYPQGLNPYKKAAMGDDSPLLGTDLCPAVTAPDGTHCVETADVMRFVGQRIGLAPAPDSAEDAQAMKLTLLMQEAMQKVFYALMISQVLHKMIGCVATAIVGRQSRYLPAPAAKLKDTLRSIEDALEESGGPYVCGANLTYADVSIFAILNEILAFDCFDKNIELQPCPKLASLLTDLEGKTRAWIDYRVREHQLGISNSMQFFADTNNPLPCCKRRKDDDRRAEYTWLASADRA